MQSINTFFRRNDTITLEQIRNFIAVYELGSVSLAAEQSHKTQPALSLSISKLEKSLNTLLIKRNRGKLITFTEDGHRFYHKISPLFQQMLMQIDEIETKNTISIGVTDDFPMAKQLQLHKAITATTQGRVRLLCDFSNRVQDMVTAGLLTFAIVKQFSAQGSKQYQWAAYQRMTFDHVDKLPIVSGHSGCFVRDLTENTLNQFNKDFYFSYLTNHVQNQMDAVISGFGIGVFEQQRITNTPHLFALNETLGFPTLPRFQYRLLGEPNSAQQNKVYPLLKDCVTVLNTD
ncbi:MAG: hypothetical protein CR977_02730 [Gammaproteobacteria bacterium]|nr:MAG: hypothetical protein CR977_02730 [Gammaproteobacteria bacterium]